MGIKKAFSFQYLEKKPQENNIVCTLWEILETLALKKS